MGGPDLVGIERQLSPGMAVDGRGIPDQGRQAPARAVAARSRQPPGETGKGACSFGPATLPAGTLGGGLGQVSPGRLAAVSVVPAPVPQVQVDQQCHRTGHRQDENASKNRAGLQELDVHGKRLVGQRYGVGLNKF